MKKVLRILLWLFIGLIIALALVPFVFKGQIQEAIRTEVNKTLNAEVDFENASLSVFKNFPALSISLDELSITGVDRFEGQSLMTADKVYLGTDLSSIIKSEEGINITSFNLERPVISLIIDETGAANYDITKATTESQNEDTFFGNIEEYKISNGRLSYRDLGANMSAVLEDVNHSGSGNFENVTFDLDTETEIGAIDFASNGIKYLHKAQLDSEIALGMNLDKQQYTFKENLTRLNNLDLTFLGDVKLDKEDIHLDLKVSAPNNKVSSILSLIPSTYNQQLANVQSEGNSYLAGYVKGIYNGTKEIYPTMELKVNLENGLIKYPELPIPIKDINLDMILNNKNSDLSDLLVDISKFSFLVDGDLITGKIKVSDALANPHIAGLIDGTLNLEKLNQAFPLTDVKLNKGTIKTDMKIDAFANDIIVENYAAAKFDGKLEAKNIDVVYDKYPLRAETINMSLSPQKIQSQYNNAYVGNSDFNGTATIVNPLAFITDKKESQIQVDASSKTLDLDNLISYSATEETAVDTLQDLSFYDKLDVTMAYEADKVQYEDYNIEQLNVKGQFINNKLKLDNSQVRLEKEKITIRGEADNVAGYVFNEAVLAGKFYVDADKIDSNKFLSDDNGSSQTVEEPVIVPSNLNVDIYPDIKELKYDKYVLNKVQGKISLADGVAELLETSAHTLGGVLNLEGLYNSTNTAQPLFDLKYNMNGFDFSKVAETSETFRILAPIISYVNGLFNSTLVMSGPLGKDMFPDLTKVTASGFLETLEGQINNFEPLEKIGTALGINKVKELSLKGTKNWFDVKDGKVILKPHDHKVDDMTFTVGGTHSLAQELDYAIKAIIPRDKLAKDKLGKNLEFGMDFLEKEASSRGVNIDLGDMIYLDIFITGTIKKPKLKVIPVGSGGKTIQDVVKDEVVKQVNVLKDTITEELEKRTEVIKDTVTRVIESKVDTLTNKVKDKVKTEADKKKEELKDKLKEKIDTSITQVLTDTLQSSLEQKAEDILGTQAKGEIDSLKSKILDWNPFKKKKN